MSPSWNFPARAEPSYEGSEPSRAELGHFNFRAETELTILTKYRKFFFTLFFPKFYHEILLVYHVTESMYFKNNLFISHIQPIVWAFSLQVRPLKLLFELPVQINKP